MKFVLTSLGEVTSGSFEWFLDGSDVELTTDGEDISAIGFTPDGRLVISPDGSFRSASLDAKHEDLLVLEDAHYGENSSGRWELYFDGSDVALNREEIEGVWIADNGDIYLTVENRFHVSHLRGDGVDMLVCRPGSLGENTACDYDGGLFWGGSTSRFTTGQADGFALGSD